MKAKSDHNYNSNITSEERIKRTVKRMKSYYRIDLKEKPLVKNLL